jgi:hypothetical protein
VRARAHCARLRLRLRLAACVSRSTRIFLKISMDIYIWHILKYASPRREHEGAKIAIITSSKIYIACYMERLIFIADCTNHTTRLPSLLERDYRK